MVFDHASKYLYISNSDGFIRRYNVTTSQLDAAYNLGGTLTGIDIASDDSFLLAAQGTLLGDQAVLQKLNLSTGGVTTIPYEREFTEGATWDVGIASNGIALITTGGGFVPVRQIDLATNAITVRPDVPDVFDHVTGATRIYTSADRSRLYLLEADDSSGPVLVFDAKANRFGGVFSTFAFSDHTDAAVSRDGTMVGTRLYANPYVSLEDPKDFKLIHIIPRVYGGVAFDSVKDRLYTFSVAGDEIIAFDTRSFVELFRLPIGETVTRGSGQFASGTLVPSWDGRYVAINTDSGISLVTIPDPPPAPSPTPVPQLGIPRSMVFDHAGDHLYITDILGFVWPYRLSTGILETPYDLGNRLNGLDIALDDSYLLVAQIDQGITQSVLRKLDLRTGTTTQILYSRQGDFGGWEVAIASNGRAFLSSHFQGSSTVPLRQIDLATNTVSVRTNIPSPNADVIQQDTNIRRSADHSRLIFIEPNRIAGPELTYNAPTDTFETEKNYPLLLDNASGAVNRNGTLVVTRIDTALMENANDLSLIHSFPELDSGVAFDAVEPILYGVNSTTDQVVAYDTVTFAEKFRINIGEDMLPAEYHFHFGSLIASQDGKYLALQTPSGIRVFSTPPSVTPTPTPPTMPPRASLSVSPATVRKGGTATFTASLTGISAQPTIVNYTMSGNARIGSDYTLSGPTDRLTIGSGQSSGAVTLTVMTMRTKGKEKAVMTLVPGIGYDLPAGKKGKHAKTPMATVTIQNR